MHVTLSVPLQSTPSTVYYVRQGLAARIESVVPVATPATSFDRVALLALPK